MTILIPCLACKHIRKPKKRGVMICDAFPDEIPHEITSGKDVDVTALDECANGIGYDPIEGGISSLWPKCKDK